MNYSMIQHYLLPALLHDTHINLNREKRSIQFDWSFRQTDSSA